MKWTVTYEDRFGSSHNARCGHLYARIECYQDEGEGSEQTQSCVCFIEPDDLDKSERRAISQWRVAGLENAKSQVAEELRRLILTMSADLDST